MFARAGAVVLVASMLLVVGGDAAPQRRGGFRGTVSAGDVPWMYDGGSFIFCRLAFRESPYGDGSNWSVDYPRADVNFPFRLGQLTNTPISRDSRGEPNHVVVTLTDPHLFQCPFIMMTEPGGAYFDTSEAATLRTYLEKGGFLWADDFWGERAWQAWEGELRKALPSSEFTIVDLPMDHPIFRTYYFIKKIPQVPSIDYWFRTGSTSERFDSDTPHARAIIDDRGRIMVFMTHNTDLGDAFQREGENKEYFDRFAVDAYALGVNVFIYAMTH